MNQITLFSGSLNLYRFSLYSDKPQQNAFVFKVLGTIFVSELGL